MADYITITPATSTWVVRAKGAVIAETSNALVLAEGSYAPVVYFPRADVAMAFLEPSDTTSICPHKGTANYFTIQAKSGPVKDAVWSYEDPISGVESIAGYLGFDASQVTLEEI